MGTLTHPPNGFGDFRNVASPGFGNGRRRNEHEFPPEKPPGAKAHDAIVKIALCLSVLSSLVAGAGVGVGLFAPEQLGLLRGAVIPALIGAGTSALWTLAYHGLLRAARCANGVVAIAVIGVLGLVTFATQLGGSTWIMAATFGGGAAQQAAMNQFVGEVQQALHYLDEWVAQEAELIPLVRSAESQLNTWAKCEKQFGCISHVPGHADLTDELLAAAGREGEIAANMETARVEAARNQVRAAKKMHELQLAAVAGDVARFSGIAVDLNRLMSSLETFRLTTTAKTSVASETALPNRAAGQIKATIEQTSRKVAEKADHVAAMRDTDFIVPLWKPESDATRARSNPDGAATGSWWIGEIGVCKPPVPSRGTRTQRCLRHWRNIVCRSGRKVAGDALRGPPKSGPRPRPREVREGSSPEAETVARLAPGACA